MSAAAEGAGERRRWLVLAAVLAGTVVGTVNNSVANVAVVDVLDEFELGVGAGVWFVTGYVLAFAVLLPLAGRLGDRYGTRRVYLAGMAGFLVASVAVATAPSYPVAAAARVAQGVCNAPVLPTVMVTVVTAFAPGVRGRAMGLWAAANGAAIAAGPPIGGVLTEAWGWRAVFWADVPLVLAALWLGWRHLPDTHATHTERIDLAGASLLVVGLVALMVALSQGTQWGWGTPGVLALVVAGLAALAAFWHRARTADAPFLDLRLLARGRFAALAAVAGLQMAVLMGVLFAVPLMLVLLFDQSVGIAGVTAFVLPVTMVLAGPAMGHLADRFGARRLTASGAALLVGSTVVLLAGVELRSTAALVVGLVVLGAGVSAIQAPTAVGVAEEVGERHRGVALGLFHSIRFVCGVVGVALFAAVFTSSTAGRELETLSDERLSRAFTADFLLAAALAAAVLALTRYVPAGTARHPAGVVGAP